MTDHHHFNDKLLATLNKEAGDIALLWNAATQEFMDGNSHEGVHAPPALVAFFGHIVDITGILAPPEFDQQPDAEDIHEILHTRITTFADAIFTFAQYCSTHGLLRANLTPCTCGEATDDEIRNLLEGRIDEQ